ncbi:MAG: radical SAM family heme chaperone HemW [Myxacorys californica WJT36-NPBG1]|jgi:oxygen-independent coproporphyrinogen-3 oxidase|nr:radical SAM family heme chaperone HemW [Myxacorys californica WJT36-NPBG1]
MEFTCPSSAYVHIPFCRRRCFYCDFPISVVGDQRNGSNSAAIAHYVEALCSEIRLTESLGERLKTVFFGGGTPSLLSVAQLNQILDALDQQFGIGTAEISMEVDPGTFNLSQIKGYRNAGVNRVSLGVQAFQPELLKACGRSHTVEDVYASIDLIRQADLENISLDLISGLPNQTLEQWQDSLTKAIALSPQHLSTYDLTIEPTTPFGKQYSPGEKPLPSDELTADLYRTANQVLTAAGYEHYEISNYAQPNYQCRHNRVYWENHSFYGFGMGATSYINGDRTARPRKTREYYSWLEQQGKQTSPLGSIAEVTPSDVLLDTLMVGLRLAEGLNLQNLAQQFGEACIAEVWKCLKPYQQVGWVELVGADNTLLPVGSTLPEVGQLRLANPEGFLFSNVVLVKLFERFDQSGNNA